MDGDGELQPAGPGTPGGQGQSSVPRGQRQDQARRVGRGSQVSSGKPNPASQRGAGKQATVQFLAPARDCGDTGLSHALHYTRLVTRQYNGSVGSVAGASTSRPGPTLNVE